MNRRQFLSASAIPLGTRQARAAERPNIVFLFSDDQRHDTIRELGNTEVETPNLDKLVRGGVAFTNAFIMGGTMGAVCVPSRAMLLAGQSLHHAHSAIIAPQGSAPTRPNTLFPEFFRQQGYRTYGIGKWHNGPRTYARCFSGGDHVFFGGMSDQFRIPVQSFDPQGIYAKERQRTEVRNATEMFTDTAVGLLREQRPGQPFLLYVAYTSPHDPRTAPKPFHDRYPPSKVRLPENFLPEHPFDNGELKIRDEQLAPWPRTPEIIRQHIADYYAMITHLDSQVGRVLDTLSETGHAGNTIVVFAGDNGLAVGQHGLMGKQNLYDHSVRVPLIISGPGLPRNQRRDQFCYLLDVFPTLCDLTGFRTPATVEGISLRGALRDSRAATRDSVYFAYRHFQRGVRTRDWKLLRYNAGGVQNTQLFDIRHDPWERNNLAGGSANAARLREMTALLNAWMRKTDDPLDLDKPDWGYAN